MRPCHPKTAVSLSESPFHLLAIYLMINSYLVMTFGWVNLFSVRFATSFILVFLSVLWLLVYGINSAPSGAPSGEIYKFQQ